MTYSIGQIAMGTAMLAVAAWGGAKAYNLISDIRAEHLINQVHQAAEEIPEDTKRKKPIGTYAPNRPLPKTKDGVPIPDSENPHTQLGTKKSTKTGETYTQGREFDITGTPVRDIHVTDHGYPKNHPNPHQHNLKPNNTGGTLKRGPPEPLEGWNYL